MKSILTFTIGFRGAFEFKTAYCVCPENVSSKLFLIQIMKWIFIVILVMVTKTSEAQINFQGIKGNWVSAELDFIYINDSIGYGNYMSNNRLVLERFHMNISNDTLTASAGLTFENNRWLHLSVYQFIILESSDSNLIVKPINQSSKAFFPHFSYTGTIKFIRQEYVLDSAIEFSKLSYSNSECQSGCQFVQCVIDSSKSITLYLDCYDLAGKMETSRSGKYVGTLDSVLFNDLIFYLQTSQLADLRVKNVWMSHRQEIHLMIQMNEITKEFNGRPHPLHLRRLDDFLCNLYHIKETLNRVEDR